MKLKELAAIFLLYFQDLVSIMNRYIVFCKIFRDTLYQFNEVLLFLDSSDFILFEFMKCLFLLMNQQR